MKRFLLFAGDWYYPSGGWDDFEKSFDTLEEARAAKIRTYPNGQIYWQDWGHIVDSHTAKTVLDGTMQRIEPKGVELPEGAEIPAIWVWSAVAHWKDRGVGKEPHE